ncbi:MAG: TetR family transcriptional regulator [Candidatus Dormibacteraeota bacterium]|uniref:TetR family transcriptional regulator n=1 Tax=Candidatus Dormiibacter inghamiae TaxID=3127013 RepID=A0A934KLF7_9BACT|nr:TetR family transcriptional regulator [Candidatus Dormibacteraeota bacterium]MBJ7606367.1 TetR family transcriptional regulator [Candidatus Dormibacteraeota bacterium]
MGLRERKKAKTRAAIQRHALRLFRDQGYAATTVNQIAEAAEISESTFFRYFPTKEAAALWDDLDPLLLEAFRGQPPDAPPVAAFRAAIRSVFGGLTAAKQSEQLERWLLIQSAPRASVRGSRAALRRDRAGRRAGRRTNQTPRGSAVTTWSEAASSSSDDGTGVGLTSSLACEDADRLSDQSGGQAKIGGEYKFLRRPGPEVRHGASRPGSGPSGLDPG